MALRFIATYQQQVSHRLGRTCRFQPTCSEYGRLAFEHYRFPTAVRKTLGRLGRCRPGYTGSFIDPP